MRAAGDLRIVTVLVTDIVDSTPIGERLGPERSTPLGAATADQLMIVDRPRVGA